MEFFIKSPKDSRYKRQYYAPGNYKINPGQKDEKLK